MKKTLQILWKIFLITFIIFISCILLVVGGIWGYQKYKHHQQAKLLEELPKDETLTFEHMLADHLDTKISDDKMTVEEKLEAGLNPYVPDTSNNGISDWDAIHKYQTDPKKFSTADDGISDYAKIQEGLDPTKPLDPKTIDEFTIENEELDIALHTNDLNAKYHTHIEPFHHSELDELYKPVREPVQIKDYNGEVEISIPENINKDEVNAYQFNFEKEKFEKIKKQRATDNAIFVPVDSHYPVYIIEEDTFKELNTYYYFRISGFDFTRELLGFDHKFFLFRVGFFTDELFEDEVIEDADYGIIELSHAEVSRFYAFFLDKMYAALDLIFKPEGYEEATKFARAIIDYGKVEGTPEFAKRYAMPWLYEHEEIETENEWSNKVIDSGFRLKVHAFPFGNLRTTTADGGVCAGFSRVTEHIFNGEGIEDSFKFKPELWRTIVLNWLNGRNLEALQYDLSDQKDHLPFLQSGELFTYRFTDEKISYLAEDKFVDTDLVINPGEITEPDQSIIKMLETQWIYSNEVKHSSEPNDPTNISILDQVEELLANGQIIYASMNNGSGGHTVSIYKMEYDKYDPDLIRFYVYDPNLPYKYLTNEFGVQEIYMEIYKKEKDVLFGNGKKEYFEFDYTPFKSHRKSYSYSNTAGYVLNLYHNDTPIHGK